MQQTMESDPHRSFAFLQVFGNFLERPFLEDAEFEQQSIGGGQRGDEPIDVASANLGGGRENWVPIEFLPQVLLPFLLADSVDEDAASDGHHPSREASLLRIAGQVFEDAQECFLGEIFGVWERDPPRSQIAHDERKIPLDQTGKGLFGVATMSNSSDQVTVAQR